MGDRRALMDAAVAAIASLPGTLIKARSGTVRSAPDGPIAQDWFANLALVVETAMSPSEFAVAAQMIEEHLGRDRAREIAWGPRTMDIDIVAIATDALCRTAEPPPGKSFDDRPFVVVPLAEIAPHVRLQQRTFAEIAAECDSASLEQLHWPRALS